MSLTDNRYRIGELVLYCDAAYGVDEGCRSRSGIVLYYAGTPEATTKVVVHWETKIDLWNAVQRYEVTDAQIKSQYIQ